MTRGQLVVGAAIGLATGLALLNSLECRRHSPPAPTGPVFSECDGPLRELVIHYESAGKDIAGPVYRDLLPALDSDITVHVVCTSRVAFAELTNAVGPVNCRLAPVVVHHAITTWSRDRWVALTSAAPGGPVTLLSPRREASDEIWPARAGDEWVGEDLAAALRPAVAARRSALYFDGGDLLADSENVFVAPRILVRNIQHTVTCQAEFVEELQRLLQRPVVLLENAPDHHAGMFITALGNRRFLVAAGKEFDAITRQCELAGYRVTRIPIVAGPDGRTYLTYNNVLLDQRGLRRIVYLPFYREPAAPNEAARAVWEKLGFEVRPVDCTSAYRQFGSLHCLVNVLRRGPA